MKTPLVSVVMSCYNAEQFLRESIESVLNQTYSNIELIIVIDGRTTDKTLEIAKSYNDERLKIIHWHTKITIPCAFNEGFEIAKGNYYTILHSDDVLASFGIEEMVKQLEQHKQYDALYADHTVINEKGEILFERTFKDINNSIAYFTGAGLALLYRKELFSTIDGYDVNSFLVEDFIFWIRAWLKNAKILKLNRADLLFYRVNANSLSATKTAISYTRWYQVFEEYLPEILPKLPKHEEKELLYYYFKYYTLKNYFPATAKKYLKQLSQVSKFAAIKAVTVITFKRLLMPFYSIVQLPILLISCFRK